jgi:site-specific DNA-methyltransferase (adenine-specific)
MISPYLTTTHGVLFSEDCLDVLPNIRSDVIDCVFADPPFNLGKDYNNGFNDNMSEDEYLEWCRRWIAECCRVLKPGGAIFIYATPELAIHFGGILFDYGMEFRHLIALSMKGTFRRGKKLYPAHYSLQSMHLQVDHL